MKKHFIALLIFSSIVSYGQSDKTGTKKTTSQKLDYFLKLSDSLRIHTNIPGVGIAIVYEGEILYKGGLGYRDVTSKAPVTENTLFPIGSNTKPITGVLASKLVEKDLLNWNSPVKKYYPEFQVADEYVTKNATVKDLFTHMTGVGRYDLLYYHNSSITRNEIMSRLPYLKSKYPIRQQYQYNNFMYLIAGVVEEKVSGKSWGALIKEEIFSPLKMNNSVTSFQEYFDYEEKSKGYKSDGVTEVEYQNIDVIAPAGSISSTPNDMAKWLKMLVNKGKVGNNDFLTKDQFDYLTGAHAPFNPSNLASMSIGWLTVPTDKGRFIQKDGAIDGFLSKVTVVTDEFGIVIVANTWTGYVTLMTDYALSLFVDDNFERNFDLEKSLEYQKPKKKNKKEKKQISLLHKSSEYIGTYKDDIYGDIVISENNNGLHFKFNDFESRMEHTGFDNFKVNLEFSGTPNPFIINFHADLNGKIDHIEFKIESGLEPSIFEKKE